MSCPNYKIVFNDETKYVVQDITEEPVVRVIPARGEQGPQGPQGEQGPQGPQGEQGIQGEDGKNFEPTVVSELPETGDSSKLYLTPKAHTTSTATGNPIEATITAQAGQIESFQLDGDTFQQTYTGKNLFNAEAIPYVAKRAYSSDGSVINWKNYTGTDEYQPVEPNTEYTIWNNKARDTTYLCEYDENKNFIQRTIEATTFTTTATTKYLRWSIYVGAGEIPPTQTQLELGATASSFEPYVGGQPSPNPSYPQDINVVTGTQTISINDTNYTISLGSLELCKLGAYQDYIYKDGESWKVHKAISSITLDGSEGGWSAIQMVNNYRYYLNISNIVSPLSSTRETIGLCSHFSKTTPGGQWNSPAGSQSFIINNSANPNSSIGFTVGDSTDKSTDFKTWLAKNTPTVLYALYTPTDAVITDQTLIAQLEAIRTASLQNGANTITNTATGTNLAGDMEIGYFGFNPTNRYDKFIWLDFDNSYEQLNNPDITTVTTTNLTSTRNLNLTNIQSVSNEINNDEEQENEVLDDAEEEER